MTERRRANDGRAYTFSQFLAWYGDECGRRHWERLDPGVVSQSGDAGVPQPGADGSGAGASSSAGAPQSGGTPWQGSVFLTQLLVQNVEKLRRECPQLALASNLREAINKAYFLQDYLPLPVEAFVDFDILRALRTTGDADQLADAVVAERIPRVRDNNRPPHCRVDFFLYFRDGDVQRYHPGRCERSNMQPHRMPFGSVLFNLAQAQDIGVGASLHVFPPRLAADAGAPQPGMVLCTRDDMNESCPYDVQMWSWRHVREHLLQLRGEEGQVDISDGHLFPWWLLLGGTGRERPLLDRGVSGVVADGRALVLTLSDGEVKLSSGRYERMQIDETSVP